MLAVLIALLVVEPSPPPKPRPTPAPVLEGRVQGPDGTPIADALVVVRAKMAWAEPPLTTKTDSAGAFRLPLKASAAHAVWVHARGLAVANRDDVRPGAPLVIRLENGSSIEGVVRDASGTPVEGARVETEPNDRAPAWVAGAGVAMSSTDRNGRFRLTGLDRRPHVLVATARGYGRARQEGVLAGRRVELFLVPGASVMGVVVDADGRPLAEVTVRLEAQHRMQWTPSARTTDATGRFAFDGVAAGSYSLIARHPELGLAVSLGVEVGSEGDVRRDVILLPGVAVTGRLVDPDEKPVSGRVVLGELFGEAAPRCVADALASDAGPDGRFRIEGVPLGAHALSATAPGHGARRVDFDARPAPSGTDLGDVTMDPGLRLRGRVRSRMGAPIADARLYASQSRGMGAMGSEATSDAAGAFVIGGLQPGSAQLHVSARGFAPLSNTVEAGGSDLELLLDPAGSIGGVVVDEKGTPVPAFNVGAEKGNYEGKAYGAFSEPDGRFLLEDVGEGNWTVQVSARGYAPASVPDVVVRPGRTTEVGRVRLTRGVTVRGQVVTPDDFPVPGATIHAVQPQPMAMNWGDAPTASSDASGLFELTGVPPGTIDLIASHPGHAEGRVRGIETDPTRPVEVRIAMGRGGRVEGTARRRDGGSLAGAFVQAQHQSRGFAFDRPRAPVGPDGSFALERVPAGPTRVVLMLSGGGGRASSGSMREVEVREGETVTVDFVLVSILVSGRVTRAGDPVTGAKVNLRMQDSAGVFFSGGAATPLPLTSVGPERGTALTDDTGFYQLLVDGHGRGWATIEAGSPPVHHAFGDVEVPDAESYTLDFALGSSPLSGVVVDAETNSPLGEAYVSARRREGGSARGRGSSRTGTDGRFRLEVEPGEYALSARRDGYGAAEVAISPGISGVSDIVLALEKGESISGRLVDARGNGVAGTYVTATAPASREAAPTMGDGHFRISGLRAGSYTLFAGAAGLGFAMLPAVTAPAEGITLQLAPGGRVRVRALDVGGSPASEAWVRIAEVDGLAVQAFDSEKTSVEGLTELATPAGVVTLEASGSKAQGSTGRVTVAVPEGQTVPAEIALKPPEKAAR